MANDLLKDIEIKDFKCFKDFKAKGFKRVNLIGGKNNAGKTAFMEACLVNVRATTLKSLTGVLSEIKDMRENLNMLDRVIRSGHTYADNIEILKNYMEQTNNISTKSNINFASFKIEDTSGIKRYLFNFNKKLVDVNIKDFSYETEAVLNIQFIDNFGLSNANIIYLYSSIQKKKEESFLNDILNKFDDRIESFKIIDNKPQCEINGEYHEVTEFGDGVRHLISIVTSLFTCENGYLFIDEIDNGIHYTQLDEIWTIILEVSERLKVQVFATTHSKECIESYSRVSQKIEDANISFISLYKDKENNLKSITLNSEEINDRIKLDLDNR